jgi:hypothetical protein
VAQHLSLNWMATSPIFTWMRLFTPALLALVQVDQLLKDSACQLVAVLPDFLIFNILIREILSGQLIYVCTFTLCVSRWEKLVADRCATTYLFIYIV